MKKISLFTIISRIANINVIVTKLFVVSLLYSCGDPINPEKTIIINYANDSQNHQSILFLCESANVESISKAELHKYLTSEELKKANVIIEYWDKEPIYACYYKQHGTLAVNSNFSTELILQIDNTRDDRFYDFLVRTYTIKTRKLIDSEVFASWTERLSGEFDKEKQVFKVFNDNEYWEYKIDEQGNIIEIE